MSTAAAITGPDGMTTGTTPPTRAYSADRPAAVSLPPSAPAARHATELDVLRALAIASVLCFHFLPADHWANRLQARSALGVPLFFTLSGFLITRILAGCRAGTLAGRGTAPRALAVFYARRFLRIFPIYYAVLAVAAVTHAHGIRDGLPWHASFLSNVYYARHTYALNRDPMSVFWTLSVEEQFYLVWPWLVLLLPVPWVPRLTLALAAVGAAYVGWAVTRPAAVALCLLTPGQLVYLGLGSYIGLAESAPFGSADRQARVMRAYLAGAIVAAAGAVATNFTPALDAVHFAMRYTATAAAFAWVVARLARGVGGAVGAALRWPPLVYIGRVSYGMYIVQFFVSGPMERAAPGLAAGIGPAAAGWVLQSFAARVVAIVAVASATWFAFERPLNELKRYLPYAPKWNGPA